MKLNWQISANIWKTDPYDSLIQIIMSMRRQPW